MRPPPTHEGDEHTDAHTKSPVGEEAAYGMCAASHSVPSLPAFGVCAAAGYGLSAPALVEGARGEWLCRRRAHA